jgi:hypothetical protein
MRPPVASVLGRIFSIVLVVGAGANQAPLIAAEQASEPYTVVVGPSEARVVFPIPARDEWEWCQLETRALNLEFEWSATVENQGQRYAFGFFLFKCLGHGSGPVKGSLANLLRDGQIGVSQRSDVGGQFLGRFKVGAMIAANQIHLVVTDPATLNLLFSDRPAVATLTVRRPGEGPASLDVPVAYQRTAAAPELR